MSHNMHMQYTEKLLVDYPSVTKHVESLSLFYMLRCLKLLRTNLTLSVQKICILLSVNTD